MVYSPQRRHAVSTLTSTAQTLMVLQHLYSPSFLLLALRTLVSIRLTASLGDGSPPKHSLLGSVILLTWVNVTALVWHLINGPQAGKSLIIDFVGQAGSTSLTRILLLDILIYIIRIIALVTLYIVNNETTLKSDQLPYDDLLLPPDIPKESKESLRRRKIRKDKWFDVGDEEMWLNEEGEIPQAFSPAPTQSQINDPPLIFSLPFQHLIKLIIHLPHPQPTRAFSGGTPPVTPSIRERPDPPLPPTSSNNVETSTTFVPPNSTSTSTAALLSVPSASTRILPNTSNSSYPPTNSLTSGTPSHPPPHSSVPRASTQPFSSTHPLPNIHPPNSEESSDPTYRPNLGQTPNLTHPPNTIHPPDSEQSPDLLTLLGISPSPSHHTPRPEDPEGDVSNFMHYFTGITRSDPSSTDPNPTRRDQEGQGRGRIPGSYED
ncbi:hypothetical protein TREMEDRAFT_65913 [Tremella mesenterica DSM 1558]|uniref:uncharacterized protein n=1 Tax=Tremella mesenterica (strain ATCC 24925 / CBS 8224 / DSM 1558 / NBRC 9311 / NRRL Y-6157 / RJB 2259-6 / UBC 559-6) TaxID=578456 RepID=UPI00032C09FD|nr:uncharacterized protein TREMEDRAFT_65913 [Tremella mesenterica DSM 1558]EIW66069.1 hypothetical protein TREMEDRAFT_65913 [Tremella mesenterica DSM 1558]